MGLFVHLVRHQKAILNQAEKYLSATVASTKPTSPQAQFFTKQEFHSQNGFGLFSLWRPQITASQCFQMEENILYSQFSWKNNKSNAF